MNPAQRKAFAARVDRRLPAAIYEDAPDGLGNSPAAWQHVEPASRAFQDVRSRFLDGEASKDDLVDAASALVEAWSEAGARFESDRPEENAVRSRT